MKALFILAALHILAFAGGIFLGCRSTRTPARGWIAFVLMLLPAVGFSLTNSFSVPLSIDAAVSTVSFFTAPLAVFYSLHAYRQASNKPVALAALVGSIIVGSLAAIGLAIIIVTIGLDIVTGPSFSK